MSRIAWIVLSVVAALLFLGFAGAAFVIASGSGSEATEPETTLTCRPALRASPVG